MDYLFRLADGRRLALWSERNQIIRQLSGGGGNRSHITLRTDFLSDFTATALDGKIYFAYQNTSRRVMLYLPDGEEDRLLFGESIESCRHGGITLAAWKGKLYLFYTSWNPVREKYSLRGRKPLEAIAPEDRGNDGREEILFIRESDEQLGFSVVTEPDRLLVIRGNACWQLTEDQEGKERWQVGEWRNREDIDRWENQELTCGTLLRENREQAREIQTREEENRQLKKSNEILETENRRLLTVKEGWEKDNQRLTEKNRSLEEAMRQQTFREADYQARIGSAVTQYNELAEMTRRLQAEGKKWREKYYQEVRKKKDRPGTVKVTRTGE